VQATRSSATGLRLIVAYKLVRGTLVLAVSLMLAWAALGDGGAWLRELARTMRHHFAGAWSLHLARWLGIVSTPRRLAIGSTALAVDGVFTLFEAWALRRGFRWARWLVIVATASLLPFEVYEITRAARLGRVLVLLANVAVVLYLIRRHARDTS